ncbi:MAG: signal peptidase II [Lachnospiraceae bacterium]|nr:signal peptidase II [Lachnospiraceae bacterium]
MMIILISVVILTALDQYSKFIALTHLKPVGNIKVIDGWFDFTFVENRGAAFGILEGQRWFFVILTIAVTICVIVYLRKMKEKDRAHNFLRLSLVLILAGAWGNAIDRLLRGYVVDYFEFTFINYPVFNVADIYVVAGTILLAVLLLLVIKDEPNLKGEGKR